MSWMDEINVAVEDCTFENEVLQSEDIDDWQVHRLGKVTGSTFGDFIKKGKDGSYFLSQSETANRLMYKIAWERFAVDGNLEEALSRITISSIPTDWGNDNEGSAILRYQELTGHTVVDTQKFIDHKELVGGTPDGFIGDDGLIEIKCPYNGGNHFKTLLTGKIYNPKFLYQIQGYLMITGRKWCDFVTFDPHLPKGLDISVNRIERDDEMISAISLIIDQVVEKIKEIQEQLKQKL